MKKKYVLYAIISIVVLVFVVLFIVVFLGATKESCYSGQIELDVHISKKGNDYEQIEEICSVCSEYVDSMNLKTVVVTYEGYENILESEGIMVLGFEKYIDDYKEGGNVRTAEIYYNSKNGTVYKIDKFEGPGRAGSIGDAVMKPAMWNVSINSVLNELVYEYDTEKLKELSSPYVKIEITNDIAVVRLFSHEKDAYIIEKCVDLTNTN